MNENDLINLIERFEQGKCTSDEIAILESWYISYSARQQFPDIELNLSERQLHTWNSIVHRRRKISYVHYLRYAAAILIAVGVTSTFYFLSFDKKVNTAIVKDIQPGGNKAILTLSNGQQISLDDTKAGVIANQSGVSVSKNKNGQIVYNVSSSLSHQGSLAQYNTITTPNGGQYQIILPDGSMVYLNAASSLKYPVNFTSDKREVTLTGEGYFEIIKDSGKPFVVNTQGQLLKVLGTHFNISCYPTETITTTLAEGKIEISQSVTPQKTTTLKPGDQSIVSSTGITVHQVNPDDVIAWKEGLFVFTDNDLKDVFKQICRWYNVDVDYASIPDKRFVGQIPRNIGLSKVLRFIEAGTNTRFTVEGRRIIKNK